MKKTLAILVTGFILASPTGAFAWGRHGHRAHRPYYRTHAPRYHHHHGHHGSDVAIGVLGGILGGIVIGNILYPPPVVVHEHRCSPGCATHGCPY
jgi:hypothetical protein